jgi:predicted PurR-regulated permease PerM
MEEVNTNIQNPNYGTKPEIVQMTKDMNFISVFVIIYGALQCLSIIGMIIGIPIIYAALRMKEAAEAFKHYALNNDNNALSYGFDKLANSFRIVKILIIVSLIVYGLLIIALITIIIPLIMQFANNYNY